MATAIPQVVLVMMAAAHLCPQTPSSNDRATYYGAYDASQNPVFSREPNTLLVDAIRNRKAGTALDVGMGSGRNSLYLATHGWQVTGFDIAEEGVRQALNQAEKLGTKIDAIVADENSFDFGANRWDLVVLTYQPFRHLLERIKTSLKDGGIVVIESFHRDSKRYRPIGDGGLINNNELIQLFSGFRILRYEDALGKPDWGIEFPVGRLVRMVAQKGDPVDSGCDWKGASREPGDEVLWGVFRLRCTSTGWEPINRKLK